MHVSIDAGSRNDLSPWPWTVTPSTAAKPIVPLPFPGKLLQQGSYGTDVRIIQQRLHDLGNPLTVDGIFGLRTRALVVDFQRKKQLFPDGIVGAKTWSALWQP